MFAAVSQSPKFVLLSPPAINEKLVEVGLTEVKYIISDVHAPSFNILDGKLVSKINSYAPDIFILGGDIVDKQGKENLVETFGTVNAKVAKFATLGNW